MTDFEMAVVHLYNVMHFRDKYVPENYYLMKNIKYGDEVHPDILKMLREHFNCLEAAYELKTWYTLNHIYSSTIVLKRREESVGLVPIKIHNDLTGEDTDYSMHAVEVFNDGGVYKVWDILNSEDVVTLEEYMNNLCELNNCDPAGLRFDYGYLVPCHALALNMSDLFGVVRWLESYGLGHLQLNLMQMPEGHGGYLSDDIYMDFNVILEEYDVMDTELAEIWGTVYKRLLKVWENLLMMQCEGQRRGMLVECKAIAEILFDDVRTIKMMLSVFEGKEAC